MIEAESMPSPKGAKTTIADKPVLNLVKSTFSHVEDGNDTLPLTVAEKEALDTGAQAESVDSTHKSVERDIDNALLKQPFSAQPQQKFFPVSRQIVKALDNAMGANAGQDLTLGTFDDLRCPNCYLSHRPGELICVGCGIVFSGAVATHKL
jgi:hypothetical protein